MSGAFRSLVIAGVVGLSVLVGESPATRAGDPTWGRLPSSSRSSKPSEFKTAYYYNNAASTSVARAGCADRRCDQLERCYLSLLLA